MRKLKTRDIPAFCRCLKKLGIKEKVEEIARQSDTAKDAWSKGFDLLWDVFDMATESEGERYLYAFLAGPFEMTAEEVADMELPELFACVRQLAAENDLAGFFKSAGALMK